jgi:hypothetical protein
VMQFFEVVLLEVGKETRRPRRMRRDVEIVNMGVPIRAYGALS